jgi:uncharacterized protein (TIGR00251 family)
VIDYSFKNGQLVLRVQVVPRASRSAVVGEHNGLLRVRIAAPPVDGAANEELVRLLARKFEVPRSAVTIVAGQSARTKQVRITDVKRDLEFVKAVLAGDKRG